MWMLWTGVLLLGLWFAGVEPLASLNGWWIALPFFLAFIWFDLIEERLGFNKNKRTMDEMEKAKKERIRKALERDKKFQPRR